MSEQIDPLLTDATYSIAETATLAGLSGQTVSNWFRGRDGSSQIPLFADHGRPRDAELRLSFLQVSETIVAALLRKNGATMARLRTAREFTRRHIKSDFPLATEQFKLSSRSILLELEEFSPSNRGSDVLVDFSIEAGQRVLPMYFTAALDRFDYRDDLEGGLAERFHPYGRTTPLVIDPRYGSGRLTITGTNIRAESVFARIDHGYTPEDIQDDLRLSLDVVKAVLQFKTAA